MSQRRCPYTWNAGRLVAWKCQDIFDTNRPPRYKLNQGWKKKWEIAMKADPTQRAYIGKRHREKSENQIKTGQGRETLQQANATLDSQAFTFFSTNQDINLNPVPLGKRWVVDTGAQVHIYNDRELFVTLESVRSSVRVGYTETGAVGRGTVVIYGVSPTTSKLVKMELYDIKYSPQFYSNPISYGLMMKGGLANVRKNQP